MDPIQVKVWVLVAIVLAALLVIYLILRIIKALLVTGLVVAGIALVLYLTKPEMLDKIMRIANDTVTLRPPW